MVIILLATFNGGKYLEQQLNSLISQTYTNWKLYIRDDGSTDNTLEIINDYILKDDRIYLINDNLGNLRSSLNFNALMEFCQDIGEYFMFCDQDDVWFETKIEETLKQMMIIENNKPALVFGTQTLVNENNEVILESRNYNFKIDFSVLLTTNFVYGCTMMINRRLLIKSISIPRSAENHDYWIALIAASCHARTQYLSKPLMYYRQHNNNVSGNVNDSSLSNRLKRFKQNKEIVSIRKRQLMFVDLLNHTEAWIGSKDRELLKNYNKIVPKGGLNSLTFALRNRIRKISIISTINYYLSILRA